MFFANKRINDEEASTPVQQEEQIIQNPEDKNNVEIFNFDEVSSGDDDSEMRSVSQSAKNNRKHDTNIIKLDANESPQKQGQADSAPLEQRDFRDMYEPGQRRDNGTTELPQLKKLPNTIKYQQNLDHEQQQQQQPRQKNNIIIMKKQVQESTVVEQPNPKNHMFKGQQQHKEIDFQQYEEQSNHNEHGTIEPQVALVCEQSDEDTVHKISGSAQKQLEQDDQIHFNEDVEQIIELDKQVTFQKKQEHSAQKEGDDLLNAVPPLSSSNRWPFPPKFDISHFPSTKPMLKNFLTSPIPQGQLLQCCIKRSKSGLARLYPVYHLMTTEGNNYMLSAKKVVLNSTSNYIVCMDHDKLSTKTESYLGKVKSNFMGTEFMLYDNGLNPKKTKNSMLIRSQLGVVYYESNILQNRGPRKMKIVIPKVCPESNIPKQFMPLNSKSGIQWDFKYEKWEHLDYFVNKPPRWNDQMQAYVLNFYGRVDKPSVKNFQLIHPNEMEKIYFQFGRVDDLNFNLDFTWPFSPLQAMQICVSSFDFKFACE